MQRLPVFRSDPALADQLSFSTFLLAYLAILVGAPALSLLNVWVLEMLGEELFGYGHLKGPLGDIAAFLFSFILALMYSPFFAWAGALMSVPLVWLARCKGWFGWATAALTGLGLFQINWWLFIRAEVNGPSSDVFGLGWVLGALGSILLGLTFWLVAWCFRRQDR